MAANEDKGHRTQDKRAHLRLPCRSSGFIRRCMFRSPAGSDFVLGRPLQPCNRALFSPLPVPIGLLAQRFHARELEIWADDA
jgi:hypothetical protein